MFKWMTMALFALFNMTPILADNNRADMQYRIDVAGETLMPDVSNNDKLWLLALSDDSGKS